MGVIEDRRRIIAAQPHPVTLTGAGGLVTFTTDMAGRLQIVSASGATVTACGRNLFDKAAVAVGDNIGTDGSISYSANARLTGYIPIGGQCVFWAERMGSVRLRIGKFSASGAWLGRVLSENDGNLSVVTINDPTVAYIRACLFVNSEDIDTAMIELGTTRTTFEAFEGTTTNHISRHGFNAVYADSGDITVTYWTH